MSPALSGIKAFGRKMKVTANNVANVNTTGFKSSRATFQDISSQTVPTTAGAAQVGRGTSVADVTTSFSQGSFESTDSTTDLAIGGKGFFVVRDPDNSGNEFYTRAGEFRFDRDGNLTTPAGHIARGWPVDSTGQATGSIGDIVLSSFTSAPSETTSATVVTNLDSGSSSNTANLELVWDGDNGSGIHMDSSNYEHQTSFRAYDSVGTTHDITVYFDLAGSSNTWEYVVTTDPSEDLRATAAGDGQGLLARGSVTFNNSGTVTGMTMDTYNGANDIGNAANWSAQSPDTNGYMTFSPTFASGTAMSVALDFGTRFNSTTSNWEPDSLSTTQYAQASSTVFQQANGYGSGALQSISVDTDGVITGQYSNGEVIPLYQVGIANFQNPDGLYKEGGNLYRETQLSGAPVTGAPGTNGLGSISPNSLEQSNVDIAKEIVNTITTQRGFEANTKVIKVTDEMLESVIDLFA
jgi:flagellar hook protein FlgE